MELGADFNYRQLPQLLPRGMIAIDGYSGSGKTTVANELVDLYRAQHHSVNLIHTDWFATWENPVGWWSEMIETVIKPLRRGESVWFRPLVWRDGRAEPGERMYLERSTVIIIEGVSAARTAMQRYLDCALWVDGGDQSARLARAIARDGEECRAELERWQEFENGWFTVDDTPSRCYHVQVTGWI